VAAATRPSFRQLTAAAARRLLVGIGEPATYVRSDGTALADPVLAALAQQATEVGEYAVTMATVSTIDVLNAEVPDPEQGDRIILADGQTWVVDRKSTDDGDITTLIVSLGEAAP